MRALMRLSSKERTHLYSNYPNRCFVEKKNAQFRCWNFFHLPTQYNRLVQSLLSLGQETMSLSFVLTGTYFKIRSETLDTQMSDNDYPTSKYSK